MITSGHSWVQFDLPIKTQSEANQREHWAAKAKRVKAQRASVALAMRASKEMRIVRTWGQWVVCLVRIGKRKLDDDNLASAFKAIRDQVANELHINDGSGLVSFRYEQITTTGEPSSRIWISKRDRRDIGMHLIDGFVGVEHG